MQNFYFVDVFVYKKHIKYKDFNSELKKNKILLNLTFKFNCVTLHLENTQLLRIYKLN